MQLLEWQYLIFLVPIGFGILYLLMMAVGLFGDGAGADTDADGGDVAAETDLDADHDVDLGHDVALDHGHVDLGDLGHADVAHPHGGHAGAEHGLYQPSLFASFIGFLGIGKVPLSILMMSYCFVWGGAGLAGVTLLGIPRAWTAVAIAAAAAVFITRHLAHGLARLIPSVETYHTPLATLVGLRGEVLYAVTNASGTVRVRDPQQNQRDVPCRVAPGAENIAAGSQVVLVRYDPTRKWFLVAQ